MENTEMMPDPAQRSTPEAEALPGAEVHEFDSFSPLPVTQNRKFKVAGAGSGVSAAEACGTDYYYG